MAYTPPPPNPSAASWSRLIMLLALAVATAVLLVVGSHAPRPEPQRRPQAADAILAGDLFYRYGQFVQHQADRNPDLAWYAGHLLSQRGIGIWERRALTGAPDPDALLRLGIIFSRTGFPEQGREMLRRLGQVDATRYSFYWPLTRLYAGDKQDPAALLQLPEQLAGYPRWIRETVDVDLQAALGSAPAAAGAKAVWERHLNRFGVMVAGLELVVGALILAGAILFTIWLGRRFFTRPARRWRAPLRVPWGLWEATEVFTIMVFLMVTVSVGISLLPWGSGPNQADGLVAPLLLIAGYCLYLGLTLLLAWKRASVGPRPWRLLGLRRSPEGTLGPALHTYGLLLFLFTPVVLYAAHHYLAAGSVFFRGPETRGGYLLYFLLVAGIAPVLEEIIFRGFIYPGLRGTFSPRWAALISAVAFTGAHLPTPSLAVAAVFVLGLALALLYERTRSLFPCIIVHALHNALVFVLMLAVMAQ